MEYNSKNIKCLNEKTGKKFEYCSKGQNKYVNKILYHPPCMLQKCESIVTEYNDNGYHFPGCSKEHTSLFKSNLQKCMMPGCCERRWFNPVPRTICFYCEKHLKH